MTDSQLAAYDDNDDTKNNELTLRSGGAEINDILFKNFLSLSLMKQQVQLIHVLKF